MTNRLTNIAAGVCAMTLLMACSRASAEAAATIMSSPIKGATAANAPSVPLGNGCGVFCGYTPSFTIKDALGTEHKSDSLYQGTGMLIMITVPNLTQYEKQKRWEKWLKKQRWPEQNVPKCVVLQDMSQTQAYADRARKMMQEKAKEDKSVLFVLDEEGAIRRQFGVLENETVILLVDNEGRIIHHEADDVKPEPEAARRVVKSVHKLSASLPAPVAATLTVTQQTVASKQ